MWRALTAYSGSRDVAQDAVAEAFAQAIAPWRRDPIAGAVGVEGGVSDRRR